MDGHMIKLSDDSYIHQEPSDGKMGGVKMAMTKRRETRSGGGTRVITRRKIKA
jgi:hypothetical protein